jgi:cyclic pyranopterin phosphate synthase
MVEPMTPEATVDRRDRPLADLRISLTDRCNFRCTYCMPIEAFPSGHQFLPRASVLSTTEVATLVTAAMRHGVRKVRLTGGEPLLRPEVVDIVAAIAATGVGDIAMTSNGSLLPRVAPQLRAAGLHRLTISLDSLREEVVAELSGGRARLPAIIAGIDAAAEAGFGSLKLNCVLRRGVNEADILPLVDFARGRGHVMRFIEYMDVGTSNHWVRDEVVPAAEVVATVAARYPLEAIEASYQGEVARRYRFADGAGELGVIASVTSPFCGDCTRLRVSADGQLFTCLFATVGTDVRELLRHDRAADLDRVLGGRWRSRDDNYSEQRVSLDPRAPLHRVEMSYIGG